MTATQKARNHLKLQAAQRKEAALALRLAGFTFESIAQQIGTSTQRAHQIVTAELVRCAKRTAQQAEALREQELQRLDIAQSAIWGRVRGGDLQAIEKFVRISESRRRLLGLDAAEKHQTHTTIEGEVTARGFADRPPPEQMTPDERRAEIRELTVLLGERE
jgi:hypothetical protein